MLISTCGDPYYIGLNGIELFDANGALIRVPGTNPATAAGTAGGSGRRASNSVNSVSGTGGGGGAGGGFAAVPSSVRVLPGMEQDVRTVDKLFDGVYTTRDDRHCWLAPFSPGKPSVLYVWFDSVICLSMIRIWNYCKTPHRGVQDLQILLDDLIIFDGYLKRAPGTVCRVSVALALRRPLITRDVRGFVCAEKGEGELSPETIVLSANGEVLAREERFLPRLSGTEQDVLFIDERRVVSQPSVSPSVFPGQRPMTGMKPNPADTKVNK